MQRSKLLGAMLAVVLAGGAGCELPVDPGSDLPDGVSNARLGPEVDTGADVAAESGADITGEFDFAAQVTPAERDREVEVRALVIADQTGEIGGGEARVTLEFRSVASPDEPGASTDEPAAIDESGSFQATISGYTVPADSAELLESDTETDIELEAQIVDSDCFRGDSTITMRDVETAGTTVPEITLEGPFEAARSGASCDGSSQGTGDAGETGDTSDANGRDADDG